MRCFSIFIVQLILLCVCSSELSVETRDKFVNGFIDYLNNLPNQAYVYEEGTLLKAENVAENTYKIEANVKVSELHNVDSVKFLHCATTLLDLGENGVSVQNNVYQCAEPPPEVYASTALDETTESLTTEDVVERRPVQLDNEIQAGNSITSGEQFIAIPREQPAPCIGCSTHVNPQADGVADLAGLGIKHLDRHEPNVRHTLIAVLDVERQVQVVNGVRYILTMTVDYNNCTETETEGCNLEKPCKITVLEKPWVRLPDGSKYRAILANNCTVEWLFGDNGEIVPQNKDNNKESNEINNNPFGNNDQVDQTTDVPNKPTPDYDKIANTGSVDDILKVIHHTELQSQPTQEKKLSDEQLKSIQEQIIPNDKFNQYSHSNDELLHKEPSKTEETESASQLQTEKRVDETSLPVRHPVEREESHSSAIPEDKKKAIDELMDFFNFAGTDAKTKEETDTLRIKRSYDPDLKVLNLVDKFQTLKGRIQNAKYILTLGQSMVDYLNEMDMEVKSRVLKDVTAAEEESESNRNFVYLQARVTIPCEKAVCDSKDSEVELCNAIMDTTKRASPQVLDAFCVAEEERKPSLSYPGYVDVNDPVLRKLANIAVKKIETESPHPNAYKIRKILNGVTQKLSGTLTKISLVLEFLDCNKTVPNLFRFNCSTIDYVGTKVCEVEIHERHQLREKSVTYSCTDRPADESFSGVNFNVKQGDVNDPKVIEVAQEALQYLEVQSDRNNKAKIVEVKSVSTKLVAGMLTNVEFIVGYTTCRNDVDMVDINTCGLIENEPLRLCEAQVWDRPWLEDGRQMKVFCKSITSTNDIESNQIIKSRSKRSTNKIILVGGPLIKDANDTKYRALAEESLKKYVLTTGTNDEYHFVQMKKVSVQVVAGSLTRIDFEITPSSNCLLKTDSKTQESICELQDSANVITCHSEVWERPWLNSKEIKVDCKDESGKSRKKRALTGGLQEMDKTDPKYKSLAEDSLAKFIETSSITKPHKVIDIKKVTVQIVAGTLTRLDFTVSPAICGVDKSGQSSNNCAVFDCHSEIWERPWLKSKEIKVTCGNDDSKSRRKRHIPGGNMEKDTSDPKYKSLAEESLTKYLQVSGNTKPHKVIAIKKVLLQVVAGTLTKIDFTVSSTESCGDTFDCHSEIWERPWLKSKEIKVTCKNDDSKSRRKRQVPGGDVEKDTSDPKYKLLAEESLTKYLQVSGNTKPHKVIAIKKVLVQVVAGTLTKIDFTVSPTESSGDTFDCHSEIWERAWLKSKEITVNCKIDENKSRQKRQTLVGGTEEKDPSDPIYNNLAQESLTKYLEASGNTQSHKVVDITKVTVQVVAGTLTKIDFRVSPVDCGINKNGQSPSANCESNGDIFDCHSEIWERPWLKSKEIKVTCKNDDSKSRTKRQVPGSDVEKDTSDPKYKSLAEESLTKYLQVSGNTKPHKVIAIKKVLVQVVAGTLTKIDFTVSPTESSGDTFDCHSEIWERAWLKSKEITVNCKIDENKSRQKRQTLVGGTEEKDPSDPIYNNLAQESLTKYLEASGNTQSHKVVDITKVTVQVVAGTLTKIDFRVSPVDCGIDKNGQSPSANCESNGDIFDCHSEIWERPWLKSKEIKVTCKNDDRKSRRKRQVPGGDVGKDTSDPKYKSLAEESLTKYLQVSGNTKPHKVIAIKKVLVQVVAGTLTKIDFTVSPTESSGDTFDCHSEIWERAWLKSKEITVNCKIDEKKSRQKRQTLVGGTEEKDPSDPKYNNLAQESLTKYLEASGNTQSHKVVDITKVTVQVVAGTLTKIDFRVSPVDCGTDKNGQSPSANCESNGNVFDCHSEIWERPWLKSKEIKVTCKNDDSKTRRKRQVPGGDVKKDISDPKYKSLAEESLTKYLQVSGNTKPHKVVAIKKVLVQVVAGTLTKIDFTVSPTESSGDTFDCHSEIWERAWLKSKEITVNCKIGENKSRQKRQTADNNGFVGGTIKIDPLDAKLLSFAEESLQKYLTSTGNKIVHKVLEIENASTQLVSGLLTKFDFKISPTNCLSSNSSQDCLIEKSITIYCHSEVWEKPWLKEGNKMIDVNCESKKDENSKPISNTDKYNYYEVDDDTSGFAKKSRSKRSYKIHGGLMEHDPAQVEYKVLAEESLMKYENVQNSQFKHKVVDVKRVLTQAVSGVKYRIDFTAVPTTCSINVLDMTTCEPRDKNILLYCHSEIWSRLWLKRKTINVICNADNDEDVNENTIGDEHFNEEQYKELVHVALKKYQKLTSPKYAHKVTKIVRVSEHSITGFLTKIDFLIAPTNCTLLQADMKADCEFLDNLISSPSDSSLFCHAIIWELSPIRSDVVKVHCYKHPSKENDDITQKARKKREIADDIQVNFREKRQVPIEDDFIDDDVKYYYAQMIIDEINTNTHSQNVEKLIAIHDIERSMHMRTPVVRMFVETAKTYCLREGGARDHSKCDEIELLDHKICLGRLYPSIDDELVVLQKNVICNDDPSFERTTGISISNLLTASIDHLEKSPDIINKLIPIGEPQLIPSLRSLRPIVLNFVVATSTCSKDTDFEKLEQPCPFDTTKVSRLCSSNIWMKPNEKGIKSLKVMCTNPDKTRRKRSTPIDPSNFNATNPEDSKIKRLVEESLQHLEMESLHRYKQRVLLINSYSTKLTSRRVTTIDFDVGYTSCLKYEWVENVTSCEFLEHLPRRHCVAQVWEKLWTEEARTIEVNCEDDETPLEAHIEFESAENAMQLAREALKHIEAKYPNPKKAKVVRVFSLEKQAVAGLHYRLKLEVGYTNCLALSMSTNCKLQTGGALNKFCRVNVWVRPWTDHPPTYRVTCDYQEAATADYYHQMQAEQLFRDFLMTYKPAYMNDNVELSSRFQIFKANVRRIHEFNVYERGTARYAVTRFSDLSAEEFRARYLGLDMSLRDANAVPVGQAAIPNTELPDQFDWRQFDAVTEVKDQGSCGSCWAFSVTGNIEGQWKMQSGQLVSLSEQELVDCDKLDNGCNGGLPDNAYRAIEQLGGLEAETDYPYEAEDDKCAFNKTLSKVQIRGAVNISSNETEMAKWLVQNGPISIGINANAMQFYVGGVSHPWKVLCNPGNLDHGVLIVGYGVKDYPLFHKHLPYWIVKNSWGKSWGEQGYYRVYRGDGTCGVNAMASSAVV